jgi:quercetin dioxygenase-like cupin family protein
MDQNLGSGAITQGMVTIEPGRQSRPHTHRVEESMTLLEGRLRVLMGIEVAEVDAPATFLAPANTVHSLRNVGGDAGGAVYRLPKRERGDVLRRRGRVLRGRIPGPARSSRRTWG